MCVWLEKPKSKFQKPLFKLFGQPRTCGETANEKCELLTIGQERYSRIPARSIRTDFVGSRRLKLSLIVSTVDRIEGSKDAATCALYAKMSRRRFINRVSMSLPSQSYFPGLDSVVGIIVSRRAKFNVLICMAIRSRKDLLHPFVELPGKSCQVLRGVEFGIFQLLWLWVERSV